MRHEHLYSKEKHNKHFLHRILAEYGAVRLCEKAVGNGRL